MLGENDKKALRALALASIQHGLQHGRALPVDVNQVSPALKAIAATFVTLEIDGDLRGCIGTLEAHRALAVDVAQNAFAAAFRDSRFPPLLATEAAQLELHISVLSPPLPMTVHDEADLLRQLRPGIDGIVLSEGSRRGTFLPSVWEQLPQPRDFLAQLKRKAGLPANYWSRTLRIERYTCEVF